ncbi:MAG: class I SAM-dependent methyltransferase [Verrucomicrobia bacterium]|nr:class I SAM-dependent methyltransferase [Verrucomicrobiota bacterium]
MCDRDQPAPLWTKENLRLVRCEACSMVYADPIRQEFASGLFYDQRGESFYLSPDKLQSDHAAVRFEREIRLFRAHCQAGAVLDVGCSTGAFLLSLQRQYPGDYSVFGTDVVAAAMEYAQQRGVQIIRGDFLDFSPGEAAFDAVTFWAVIEHLAEPKKFLHKAASLLKPGGICFVLVPNLRSLAVRILGSRYRYIMPDHLNYFTPATLKAFGASCAPFELIKLGSTHFNPIVILKDLRSKAGRVPDADRAQLLKKTTTWKQNRLLWPIKLLYSAAERFLGSLYLADNVVIVLQKRGPAGGDDCAHEP